MNILTKIGVYIIKLFNAIGTIILAIPNISDKLKNINSHDIQKRIDTENLKNNISKIRDNIGIDDNVSNLNQTKNNSNKSEKSRKNLEIDTEESDSGIITIKGAFTSEQKERTILILQILSALFIIISIIFIFNFMQFFIYLPIGIVIVGCILYLLYNKVKLMYRSDFPAYRDFFLMYVAVGIILVIVSTNSDIVNAISFSFLPSVSILIIAVIAILAVYLIFRLRYYRNFTYGSVIEGGKKTAYVKVEYDIRSNVKPDIYIVENSIGAVEGEVVKLKLNEKFLSMGGNKPVSITNIMNVV